jgi:hypothetical protein
MPKPDHPSIFISYSRDDSAVVQHVVEMLRLTGADIYVDVQSLRFGEKWWPALRDAIIACDRVLVFWGKNAAASDWVLREIDLAVDTQKVIVPISVDGEPLPPKLSEFHGISDLKAVLADLHHALQTARFDRLDILGQRFVDVLYS